VKWAIYFLLVFFLLVLPGASSQASKTEYRCVRWAWSGDVFNRKTICLEWKKK
jgi:hypothetical protein